MSGHTPGPWFYKPDTGKMHAILVAGEKLAIFKVAPLDEDGRLMAAAPELLEALTTMYAMFNGNGITPEDDAAIDAARSAIAKATGVAP